MVAVEYKIDLKDLVSDKLRVVTTNVQQTVGKVTSLQERFQKFSKFSSLSIDGLNQKLRTLYESRNAETSVQGIRRLNTEIRRTERQVRRLENLPPLSFIERIRKASTGFVGMAKNAFGALGVMGAFQGIKGIVKLGSDLEMTHVAFETMLGNGNEAKKLVDGLNDFANMTPFENQALYEQAKLLLNFGSSVESVVPDLKMIGDVAMGDAQKLSSLTEAFAKVQSYGKMSGLELKQMITSGFNPLDEISRQTGKSMEELRSEMSKGAITADMLKEAFKSATSEGGRFYNMSGKMSQTAAGKFSTLMGKLKLGLSDFGLTLVERLKPVIDYAIGLIDNFSPVSDMFKRIWQSVQPVLSGLWQLFTALFGVGREGSSTQDTISKLARVLNLLRIPIMLVSKGLNAIFSLINFLMPVLKPLLIAYAAWTAAQWLLNMAVAANPIGLIITGIVLLVGAIVWVVKTIRKHWEQLTDWFAKMVKFWAKYLNPFGWLLQLVKYVLPDAYEK
ncbi:MAG TPA: hypothetical protein ENN08_07180, partial [Bacteroidales bacterium]|nr:hypothetical protein [Bacteroidales bacterium]